MPDEYLFPERMSQFMFQVGGRYEHDFSGMAADAQEIFRINGCLLYTSLFMASYSPLSGSLTTVCIRGRYLSMIDKVPSLEAPSTMIYST